MINIISWSKNRACQLDLTLSTFKKYFKEWSQQPVSIIYTHTLNEYKCGYDIVKKLHPEFNWILESNFRQDTINCFNKNNEPYVSFFVDDDIFIDYFSLEDSEMKEFFSNKNIACLSPRLAPYVNFCYTRNYAVSGPQTLDNGKWQWKGLEGDWGYPYSIACFHIFRKEDLNFINTAFFKAPNSFEGTFLSGYPKDKELMICYKHAKCICSTNNKVQTENDNRNSNTHSLEKLNFEFIKGNRLCPDANHQYKLNMCHGPMKYIWRTR